MSREQDIQTVRDALRNPRDLVAAHEALDRLTAPASSEAVQKAIDFIDIWIHELSLMDDDGDIVLTILSALRSYVPVDVVELTQELNAMCDEPDCNLRWVVDHLKSKGLI